MSAALLASLMATVAAPAAFAALTSTTGGNIVPGGDPSAVFTLTAAEDLVDDFVNGSFTVNVLDNAGADGNVTWDPSSVPSVTVLAGVGGATAGFVGDTLVVNVTGSDLTKIDSFRINNLKVAAGAGAAAGAVIFSVTADGVGLPEGLFPAAGVTTSLITGGSDASFTYALNAGSPDFQVTGTACDSAAALAASSVTVAAYGVVPAETFSAVAPTGVSTVTKSTPLTGNKAIGTGVTQNVCDTRFPSAVTVGDAVDVTVENTTTLQAGVNSQDGGDFTVQLGFFTGRLLRSGDTVTITNTTAGVLFSPNTVVTTGVHGDGITIGTPTLSADRKSITVALTAGATADDHIHFRPGPNYDVASGVANGTAVNVAVTVSRAGVTVLGSPATVGYVGFVVAGSTAAPNVLIGQNDQSTGMITLRESAAGAMGDGNPTDNDLIEVCLESNWGESWSVGRYFWAVVTTGDLKLNVAGLPVSQGKMAIVGDCLQIDIYTESTVASTVEIRNGTSTTPDASGATNGPKVNIPNSAEPGPVYVDVYVDEALVGDNIIIAIRAYSGTPIVTVSSQPNVTRGGIAQPIGNIIITEGAPNQFADLEEFQICLVNSGSFFNPGWVDWSSQVGINQPVVSTNSTVSGLIAFLDATDPDIGDCFDININDTGIGGLGVITISNLKIDVQSTAPFGAVFVRVFDGNDLDFEDDDDQIAFVDAELVDQTVSPATVGNPVAGAAATRLGVTQIGAFTTSTKVAATGKYVTYRFDFGVAAAGKTFQIWGATKTGNDWSAFSVVTSRVANASGVVYYYIRSNSATWKSYRAFWSGGTAWTPARQARWIS